MIADSDKCQIVPDGCLLPPVTVLVWIMSYSLLGCSKFIILPRTVQALDGWASAPADPESCKPPGEEEQELEAGPPAAEGTNERGASMGMVFPKTLLCRSQ